MLTRLASERRRAHPGLVFGLLLFGLEAVQGIGLPLLFKYALGVETAAAWVLLTSSTTLLALACAAQGQAVVRNFSVLQTGRIAQLPANWFALRRTLRMLNGAILLIAQVVFLWVGDGLLAKLGAQGAWAVVIFMLGQHVRGLAFGNFMALNGARRVGQDKALLLLSSGVQLLLIAVLLSLGQGLLPLAMVSLAAQLLLWIGSERQLAALPLGPSNARLGGWKEGGGLFLLGLAGYFSVNTDLLLSAALLSPQAQIEYAIAARCLYVPVALVGLWAQLRFPFWSASELSLRHSLHEVLRLGACMTGLTIALALMLFGWATRSGEQSSALSLPTWMLSLMIVNSSLAAMTSGVGQVLLAKRWLGFLAASIPLALLAPWLAFCMARLLEPEAFVLGYSLSSCTVLWALAVCVRRGLTRPYPGN